MIRGLSATIDWKHTALLALLVTGLSLPAAMTYAAEQISYQQAKSLELNRIAKKQFRDTVSLEGAKHSARQWVTEQQASHYTLHITTLNRKRDIYRVSAVAYTQ